MNADYIGRPESATVPRDRFPVPHGKVLCRCGGVIRLRVNGTVAKHDRWANNTTCLGVCPMSGAAATSGQRL